MTPKIRSFSGAALMLVIIPMFAGLLACMPVPVGDAERSRVDPGLNGAWVLASDSDLTIYQFVPWDKRTCSQRTLRMRCHARSRSALKMTMSSRSTSSSHRQMDSKAPLS